MNKNLDELEKEVDEWLDDINTGERYENISLNWWFDEDASNRYGPDYHFSIVVAQQTNSDGDIDVSLCEVGEDWVEVTPFSVMNRNVFYLSGAGSYTYEELCEALCIDIETDDEELDEDDEEEY